MTRTKARQIALQISFAVSNSDQNADEVCNQILDQQYFSELQTENELYSEELDDRSREYITKLVGLVDQHKEELDSYIAKYSQGWKLDRISPMTKEILRIAMCETLYFDDVPVKVAINEAVELAKIYDDSDAATFINGVMGGFVKDNADIENNG